MLISSIKDSSLKSLRSRLYIIFSLILVTSLFIDRNCEKWSANLGNILLFYVQLLLGQIKLFANDSNEKEFIRDVTKFYLPVKPA